MIDAIKGIAVAVAVVATLAFGLGLRLGAWW